MTTILDAALWYAAHRLPVFPCRGKIPIIKDGDGVHDATTNPKTIVEWWSTWPNANVAIAVPGHLVVVDVDGPEGWAALRGANLDLPSTLSAVTGRSDRHQHLWYRLPEGVRIKNAVGLVEKVDTRSSGGYVIAPPSRHPETGRTYQWVDGWPPSAATIADASNWLIEAAAKGAATSATEWATLATGPVMEGGRNAALARLAGLLFRRLPAETAAELSELWATHRCEPPLPVNEVRRTIVSIATRELTRRSGVQ